MGFKSFGLPTPLITSLDRLNFKTPTPVQEQTISVALAGNDVLVSSQTGTGKTAAFAIPIIAKLIQDQANAVALVITPTRELASQVMKTFKDFISQSLRLKTALLIGGELINKQLAQLRQQPNIVVGTPGRINDHLKRKSLNLSNVKFLVLDETDRMLDMGFSIQINDIINNLPSTRQTLLFSATLPNNIIKMAQKYMSNPQRIAIGSAFNPVEKIKQEVLEIKEIDKYQELLLQLEKRQGSIVVFVKTKHNTERVAKKLRLANYEADAIHGDLKHSKREKTILAFRNQKYKILVATDVAARGLDIPHIQHVINYDLPQCPEDYIHRIGRTARAGQNGESLSFVSPAEKKQWHAINCFMNPSIKKEKPKLKSNNNKHKHVYKAKVKGRR